MAAIEKIYGNKREWNEIKNFLISKGKKQWVKQYMHPEPDDDAYDATLCHFGQRQDNWLFYECDLPIVQIYLIRNCGYKYPLPRHITKIE
jgi:hypothetical protein